MLYAPLLAVHRLIRRLFHSRTRGCRRARAARALGEIETCRPARHANHVLQMLIFGVRPGKSGGGGVRAADIARVPNISPARRFR
jgi:hypothetical protein